MMANNARPTSQDAKHDQNNAADSKQPVGAYQEAGFRQLRRSHTGMDMTSLGQESADVGMASCSYLP